MRPLTPPTGRLARCALLACVSWLAGCAGPARPVPAVEAVSVKAPAAAPAPVPRLDVIDGNAWTDALAAVTRELQQAALSNGEVEVVRTPDNRLRLRIDVTDAFDRRGAALQPEFRRFAEDMAGILARHPSVQVQVVGYSRAPQAAATRQALGWARSGLRVLATHGVGAERLTARARAAGEAEPGSPMLPAGRCIEFLLSDPVAY
jgi:outer membrane protein OmpA-like peptidoglycan-associated protein